MKIEFVNKEQLPPEKEWKCDRGYRTKDVAKILKELKLRWAKHEDKNKKYAIIRRNKKVITQMAVPVEATKTAVLERVQSLADEETVKAIEQAYDVQISQDLIEEVGHETSTSTSENMEVKA